MSKTHDDAALRLAALILQHHRDGLEAPAIAEAIAPHISNTSIVAAVSTLVTTLNWLGENALRVPLYAVKEKST